MKRLCCLLLLLIALPAAAQPKLVLIIDDLGDNLTLGQRTVDLPGAVNVAVLPHTPYAVTLAERAHARGKTVLLHTPMTNHSHRRPGPGTLRPGMRHSEFLAVLRHNLDSVPHVEGVNNHMGSELTERPLPMTWLMRELRQRGLFFVDSRTTRFTSAERQAVLQGVPNLRRHVFLDHQRDKAAIAATYENWLEKAKREGMAVAIGHPYPETLQVLEQRLPGLLLRGMELISASEALQKTPREKLTLAQIPGTGQFKQPVKHHLATRTMESVPLLSMAKPVLNQGLLTLIGSYPL